jgi:type IV secretory pathway TraG/TraD family ATPase VirD4
MQKMLGKTTIRQRSTSDSKSGQSVSYTPTEVPLMSLDEIGAINDPNANRDDCIVVVRDCDPIVGRKLLLYEHCRAKEVDKAKDIINIELFWRNNNESKQEIKEVKVG